MVITNVDPLRAYLFNGGVLPFGSLKGEQAAAQDGEDTCALPEGPVAPASKRPGSKGPKQATSQGGGNDDDDDRIVNLWRNRGEAIIWSVEDFRRHLEEQTGSSVAFEKAWAGIQRTLGTNFALPLLHTPVPQWWKCSKV